MWLAHSASDSSLFYGLHKAKPMVVTLEEVWVCPGQPSEELLGWQLASPVVPQGTRVLLLSFIPLPTEDHYVRWELYSRSTW